MYKAVVFDLDETLVSLSVPVEVCLKEVFSSNYNLFNTTLDFSAFVIANGRAFNKLIEKYNKGEILLSQFGVLIWYETLTFLNHPLNPDIANNLYSGFVNSIINHTELNKGAKKVLRYLKKEGYKIGIISNGSFVERVKKIEKVGIADLIDVLVTTEVVGEDKPSLKPFREMSVRLDLPLSELLYIGNSYSRDIVGAKRSGVAHLLYSPHNDGAKYPPEIKIIDDLKKLKEYIGKDKYE